MKHEQDLADEEYRALASFRFEIRRFLHFSLERAREADLNPAQHQALLAVRAAPGRRLNVGELGRILLLKPHTASELATRLTRAGLLTRVTGSDARERLLEITPKGEKCLRELSQAHREEVHRIRPTLAAILRRLGDSIDPPMEQ